MICQTETNSIRHEQLEYQNEMREIFMQIKIFEEIMIEFFKFDESVKLLDTRHAKNPENIISFSGRQTHTR